MAIEKMKKLRLLAVRAQRDALLKDLMLLGCLEVSEPGSVQDDEAESIVLHREAGGLTKLRTDQATLSGALRLMDKYAPAKSKLLSPKPEVSEDVILDETTLEDNLALAERVEALDEKLRRIGAEESRQRSLLEALRPWQALDLPLELTETERTAVLLGTMPALSDFPSAQAQLEAEAPEAQLYLVSSDKEQKYLVAVLLKERLQEGLHVLREYGFSTATALAGLAGTVRENISRCEERRRALAQEHRETVAQVAAEAAARDELKLCIDRMSAKIARAEAVERLQNTETAFLLEGWVLARKEPELAQILSKYDCAWETEDPDPEKPQEVPVKLRNNKLTRPYNVITEMYGLPAYNGLDPNPFIMPAFALFFGIMFADMAYGLIMLAVGLIVLKKAKPRGTIRNMMGMLVQCGITAFIMGFFTGSFFGDAVSVLGSIFGKEWTLIPTFATLHLGGVAIDLPLNLLEGNNPLYVLLGAMCLGVIHLAVGVGLGVYFKFRDGEWLDAILNDLSWWVILIGLALMLLDVTPVVLYVGIAMMVLGAVLGGKGFGRITGIFSAVYNGVTGYLGDILSYSRLMALMLAGSVIASVFNQLGALGGIWLFIPVFLIGHVLNFGLNLIGCFVHTMRLQFLEFFGKWYRDGGRPFRPLAIQTKYVYIKEDN